MEQAIQASHSEEALQARKNAGGYSFSMEQCHTAPAIRKSTDTRIESGAFSRFIAAAHTPEMNRLRADSRKKTARKVISSDGFIGCVSELSEHYGITRGCAGNIVYRTYKWGSYSHKGVTFEIYEEKLYSNRNQVVEESPNAGSCSDHIE